MAITFGSTSAPSNITTYLDSVFTQSLANYRKQLIDNIGASNAFLYDLIKSEMYETADGGTYFGEPLMYQLAPVDSYDGYDELSTLPTDGITEAVYQWIQMASPISYSMKEVIQNERRILDLVKSRIQQSEMGIQEGWAQAFMWGAAPQGGAMTSPRVSPVNNSNGVNPLPFLVSYNTAATSFSGTTGLTVGNINEASNTWWQNRWATSAATTYSAYIYEIKNMFNRCGLGTGGKPTHLLLDQVSYQNAEHAYFAIYKNAPGAEDNTYPFVHFNWLGAKVIMDDKVPDAYSGTVGTLTGGEIDPSTLTYGSCYFLNQRFFKVRYHPERDWELLRDENGKAFVKPINGDSRVGHVAWMGQTTCNNRRKQGVLAKIARTLT